MNVFIPLVDLHSRNGPTEFCLGSHILHHDGYNPNWLETPTVPAGTPVMLDYQLGCCYTHSSRPPRFQPSSHYRFPQYTLPCREQEALDHAGRPYTFNPLFVEDPLSIGNNVGQNAFCIFQVQRAFSDAHRALVASLEWDIHSSHDLNDGGGEYPLLNCLLQSDDVFYELVDDAR